MLKKTSKIRGLKIGDLVYHLLHGKEWLGILLGVKEEERGLASPREIALVRMVPGTRHEFFFEKSVSRQNKISASMGYVSTNWLFKVEVSGDNKK